MLQPWNFKHSKTWLIKQKVKTSFFVHGVTQDNNLCLGNLKSAVDTDQLFPTCVLYDYNYIEQNSPWYVT